MLTFWPRACCAKQAQAHYFFSALTINAGDIWASKQITSQTLLRWAGY